MEGSVTSELLALAKQLEESAQYDNSSSGCRWTMDDVAEKLKKLAMRPEVP